MAAPTGRGARSARCAEAGSGLKLCGSGGGRDSRREGGTAGARDRPKGSGTGGESCSSRER